jgi:hypothetical protein
LRARRRAIYAAGDICEYESAMHGGHVRIEHWDVAFNHGKTVARNMLGEDVAHEEVPYFYSVLGDWGELEYVGPAYDWDEEIVRGSREDGSFTNWYLKDGVKVKAALTFGRSDDLDHARRLISDGSELGESTAAGSATLDADLATVGSYSQRGVKHVAVVTTVHAGSTAPAAPPRPVQLVHRHPARAGDLRLLRRGRAAPTGTPSSPGSPSG